MVLICANVQISKYNLETLKVELDCAIRYVILPLLNELGFCNKMSRKLVRIYILVRWVVIHLFLLKYEEWLDPTLFFMLRQLYVIWSNFVKLKAELQHCFLFLIINPGYICVWYFYHVDVLSCLFRHLLGYHLRRRKIAPAVGFPEILGLDYICENWVDLYPTKLVVFDPEAIRYKSWDSAGGAPPLPPHHFLVQNGLHHLWF